MGWVVLNESPLEKSKFSVMLVSHWLNYSSSQFLVGHAMYSLSPLGPLIEDSILLRILLLGSVIDNSFRD